TFHFLLLIFFFFFFSSRRRHTRSKRDWSSDVCSSDLSTSFRPSFSRLQQRLGLTRERDVEHARKDVEVHVMLFDLLVRGGDSLQIGRASCRERVEMSTVDLALKRQSITMNYSRKDLN